MLNSALQPERMSISIENFARQNVAQFVQILRETLPDATFPDNLTEMMWETMTGKEEERTLRVKTSILHLKKFPYELPFMPDAIDYKIGEGCCGDIVFAKGLFTPCSKSTKEGECKCKAHTETPSIFGTYEERLVTWDEGRGIGKMAVIGEKTYKESTYGEYCKHASITSDIVRMALRRENVNLQIDPRNYEVRTKEKKVRGRPTKNLLESHSESDSEEEKVEVVKEKVEEKQEKVEEKVEVKSEEKVKEKKETKKKAPPKPRKKEAKGTSLDGELVREDYEGELEDLEEYVNDLNDGDDGKTYWIYNDEKVYNAEKKWVGTVKDAKIVLF